MLVTDVVVGVVDDVAGVIDDVAVIVELLSDIFVVAELSEVLRALVGRTITQNSNIPVINIELQRVCITVAPLHNFLSL